MLLRLALVAQRRFRRRASAALTRSQQRAAQQGHLRAQPLVLKRERLILLLCCRRTRLRTSRVATFPARLQNKQSISSQMKNLPSRLKQQRAEENKTSASFLCQSSLVCSRNKK